MTVLNSQKQIAEASTKDLVETYNALSGKPPIKKFESRGIAEARVSMAILSGQDRAAHAGVPKGTKVIEPLAAGKDKPGTHSIGADEARSLAKRVLPAKKASKTAPKKTNNAMGQMAKAVTKKTVDPLRAVAEGECPLCGAAAGDQTPAGKEGTIAGDERRMCHHCGQEYWSMGTKAGEAFQRRSPGRDASSAIRASWGDAEVRAARSLKQRVMADGTEYKSVLAAFTALGLPVNKHIKFRMELKAAGKATFRHGDKAHKFTIVAVS